MGYVRLYSGLHHHQHQAPKGVGHVPPKGLGNTHRAKWATSRFVILPDANFFTCWGMAPTPQAQGTTRSRPCGSLRSSEALMGLHGVPFNLKYLRDAYFLLRWLNPLENSNYPGQRPGFSLVPHKMHHRQLTYFVFLWSRANATFLRAWDKSSMQRRQTIADERRSTSFKQWTHQDVFKFSCNDEIDCFDPTPRIELHVFIGRARHVSKSR